MRTFSPRQNRLQKSVSGGIARPHPAQTSTPDSHHRADRVTRLQRAIGNQALARLSQPAIQRQPKTDAPAVKPDPQAQIDHVISAAEKTDLPTVDEAPAMLAEVKELYARKAAIEAAAKEAARKGEVVADKDKGLSAVDEARRLEL